jgi:short-subunit dehydrogenase
MTGAGAETANGRRVWLVTGASRGFGMTSADPPSHLQLGSDCVARTEAKLSQVTHELAEWGTLALSTDHDDARS